MRKKVIAGYRGIKLLLNNFSTRWGKAGTMEIGWKLGTSVGLADLWNV